MNHFRYSERELIKISKCFSGDKAFFILLFLYLLINFTVLFEYYPTGDEAWTGIVGKHISEGKVFPFFIYGMAYNGADTFFSYSLATSFLVFGFGIFAYRITLIVISSIFLFLAYFFCRRFFRERTAIICVVLFIFGPVSLVSFYVQFADYLISAILNLIIVILFFELLYRKEKKIMYFVLLGLFSAISYYALEYAIPVILTCLFIWFLEDRRFMIRKEFFITAGSFIVGLVPLIIYNLTHSFENIKQLLAGTFLHKIVCKFHLIPSELYFGSKVVNHCDVFNKFRSSTSFEKLFMDTFPSFFGKAYYILFLISIIWVIYNVIRGIMKKERFDVRYQWMFVFVILYLALYCLSGFSDIKHLLPLYPMILIIFSIIFYRLYKFNNMLFYISFSVLIIVGMVNVFSFSGNPDVPGIMNELYEENISYIYAPYGLKWTILFHSGESIIAGCENMCYCGSSGWNSRYPLYEEWVREANASDFIVPEDMISNEDFKSYKKIYSNYLIRGEYNITDNLKCKW